MVDNDKLYACNTCAREIERGGISDDEGYLKLAGTLNIHADRRRRRVRLCSLESDSPNSARPSTTRAGLLDMPEVRSALHPN
jgi:hypothetical protein